MKEFSQTEATADTGGFAVGVKPTGSDIGRKLPSFRQRSRPFRLAANQKSWELIKLDIGWRLVPVLKVLWLHPGANWTALPKRASDGISSSMLEARARDRWNDTVLVNIDEYMRVFNGINNSKGYFLTWERVRTYNDGEHEVAMDESGYAKWRYGLVERGIIESPRQRAIDFERNRWKKRLKRYRSSTKGNFAHLIAQAEERLAGVEEAVEALKSLGKGQPIADAAAPPLAVAGEDAMALIAKLQAELAELRAAQDKPAPRRRSRKKADKDEAADAEEAA